MESKAVLPHQRLFTPNFTAQSCDLWIEAALGPEVIVR